MLRLKVSQLLCCCVIQFLRSFAYSEEGPPIHWNPSQGVVRNFMIPQAQGTLRLNLMLAPSLDTPTEKMEDFDIFLWAYEHRVLEDVNMVQQQHLAREKVSAVLEDILYSSLQNQHPATIEVFLNHHAPAFKLSEPLARLIIFKSLESHAPGLVRTLALHLDDAYLREHSFIGILLALAVLPKNPMDRHFMEVFSNFEPFAPEEKLSLAGVLYQKGHLDLSRRALKEIETLVNLEGEQWYYAAQLYAQLTLVNEGLSLIEKEKTILDSIDHENFEKAWLLLATAAGKAKDVLATLSNHDKWQEDSLREFLMTAMDYRQKFLALKIAQILHENFPSNQNLVHLAQAHYLNQNPLLAIDLLERLDDKSPLLEGNYLKAIKMASEKHPAYRQKLRDVILHQLATHPIAQEEQRNLAYLLLEDGYREEAANVLQDLCLPHPFNHPDVQTLLHLWGNPTPTNIQWIFDKAKKSPSDEKKQWINHLRELEQYDSIIALISWDELGEQYLADAYLDALLELRAAEDLTHVISYLALDEKNPERLMDLGLWAFQMDNHLLAEKIYYQAYLQNPQNPEVLKNLCYVNIALGHYKSAEAFAKLHDSLESEEDPEYNYHYAKVLKFNNQLLESQRLFTKILTQLKTQKNKDIRHRKLEAKLYFELENDEAAMRLYHQLLQENPQDLSLRAELAHLYMDHQNIYQAKKLLSAASNLENKSSSRLQQYKALRDYDHAKARLHKSLDQSAP